MIREEDLREAIAECEGRRHPDAGTCVKLAAFYTILEKMEKRPPDLKREPESGGYSYQAGPDIPYGSSEFSEAVAEKGIDAAWPIIEKIIQAVAIIQPSLYEKALRKIRDI